jgi:hypothetical protein
MASRPKTIDEVSAQEHTIAVLRKTLTSTNVCAEQLIYGWLILYLLVTSHVILRATGNWEDVNDSCTGTAVIRVTMSQFAS